MKNLVREHNSKIADIQDFFFYFSFLFPFIHDDGVSKKWHDGKSEKLVGKKSRKKFFRMSTTTTITSILTLNIVFVICNKTTHGYLLYKYQNMYFRCTLQVTYITPIFKSERWRVGERKEKQLSPVNRNILP